MKKNIILSKHAIEQIKLRNISEEVVWKILDSAIAARNKNELTIYQGTIEENKKRYLIRIFVNELHIPPVVVTVYKTSKINKYL